MLNAKAFANATATVIGVWIIVCALLAYLVPDVLFAVAQSWTHAMNLEALRSTFVPDLGSLLLGFVTAVGLTWLTTYGTISLYNKLAKGG